MFIENQNLLEDVPSEINDEIIQVLVESGQIRIERILSAGHFSPAGFWYDQPCNEWVMVMRGAARLLLEDEIEPRELKPGDWINLPAHCRHRVEWTDPEQTTIWLAVHYPAGDSSQDFDQSPPVS